VQPQIPSMRVRKFFGVSDARKRRKMAIFGQSIAISQRLG
jgi:hypothetical protein